MVTVFQFSSLSGFNFSKTLTSGCVLLTAATLTRVWRNCAGGDRSSLDRTARLTGLKLELRRETSFLLPL